LPFAVLGLAIVLAAPQIVVSAAGEIEASGSLTYEPVPPTTVVESITSNTVTMSFPPGGGPFAGKAALRLTHDVPARGCRFQSGHDWEFSGTYNAATRAFRGTYVERAEATTGACTGLTFARTFNPDTGPFQAVLDPRTGELTSQIPPLKFTLRVDPALLAPAGTQSVPPAPRDTSVTTVGPGTTGGTAPRTQAPTTTPGPGALSTGIDGLTVAIGLLILLLVALLALVLRSMRTAVSAGPAVDIERMAAQEIALDEARSAGWESPKSPAPGIAAVVAPLGRPTLPGGVAAPANTLVRFAIPAGLVLAIILLMAIFLSRAFAPGTPGTAAGPGQTTQPAQSTAPAPGQSSPASGQTTATVSSFAEPDPRGDAVTDTNRPAPDDAVVDIVNVQVGRAPNGRVNVLVSHAARLPASTDPMVSRAVNVLLGTGTSARSPGGLVLAGQVQSFTGIVRFFWQLHDGQLTMGAIDERTGRPITTSTAFVHRETVGIVTFDIPGGEVPTGANAVAVVSYHRPTPADERRRDTAGPFLLPGG
jgi:hypothetical protein